MWYIDSIIRIIIPLTKQNLKVILYIRELVLLIIIKNKLRDMRQLATTLGCLVIATYATVGQATEHHD